jgi:hypothetical protein
MAVVAAFSAVRKDAVLAQCAFTQVNTQIEKGNLRRADWRAPSLFDGQLGPACERLARETSNLVNTVTADAQAKQRRSRPQASAAAAAVRAPSSGPSARTNKRKAMRQYRQGASPRSGRPQVKRPHTAGGKSGQSL